MSIPKEKKDEIVKELDKRLKTKNKVIKCPVCGHNNFSFIDGYTHRILNDKIEEIKLSGVSVPSITLVCNNCGNILDFSLGFLGFLNKQEEDENVKK